MIKLLPQQFKVFRKVHKGLIRKYEGPFEIIGRDGEVAYKRRLCEWETTTALTSKHRREIATVPTPMPYLDKQDLPPSLPEAHSDFPNQFLNFFGSQVCQKIGLGEVAVMKNIANLRVYYNELQNGLCNNIQSHISKRVSNILYRNPVQVFGGLIQFQMMPITDDASMQHMLCIYQQTRFHVPMIELYVEFEQQSELGAVGEEVNVDELEDIDWEEDNNDSEEEFEANYEVDDENDDGDLASEGNAAAEDGEFRVEMKFGSRESVISAIKSYTISRRVDYTVYESEPQTFYAKCKGYGAGCDWLIRASLIRKKVCWEIRIYNGKHTCTVGMISQDHAKLDSNTIADAIRPLVEADPSIKVKSVIAEVQGRFNYAVSYRKAWLAKQKAVAKVFGDWEVSYQTLPVWLKAMTVKMPRSRVQIKTLPVYRESEEIQGVRVLHRVFWSFYPCIVAFRHCKPLVQVDGTHLY
ncbi:uncharacterized protein LOC107646352 [Arachis ipaensis]|uniref:uncharacterized protein LOC107646352 n=1 Tax=Arachis ipaensis TaxID=130454 RepID=UPI0007AF0A59|nr:uncharacterized protein LOC107646352 [Arachis ipaensis]